MKNIYVADLKKSDILTDELFAIQNIERLQTKDGKPYVRVFLTDKTGTIVAQIWSDNLANVERGALEKGAVIMIDAKVEEFKGNLQLSISKAKKVSEQFIDDFVEGSQFKIEDMWEKLEKYIKSIKDENISKFLDILFSDNNLKTKFKIYPAAEYVHHSFQGGLLEHVVEMIDISEPMKIYYPKANFDIIYAGIILHDIGKLLELNAVGMAIQRTVEGHLLGHLIKSYELLIEKGTGVLNDQNMLALKHVVLSHHNELEYGSPVKPVTLEAMIVSKIDYLSSQTRMLQRVLDSNSVDEMGFTEYDRILGNKAYTGFIQK
jgi:3'-5' exoribonuclease